MTRAPVADRVRGWEVAAFAAAFAVAMCVGLALAWANTATYQGLVGGPSAFTRIDTGERVTMSLDSLSRSHEGWASYVTGRSGVQPADSAPWYTDDERRHMSDVRSVFIAAQALALGAAVAIVALARRAARRGALPRLARAGAVGAAVGVGILGAAFALAFDAAFLLFHEVLFPQGNFLFPAGSNLLVVYPEPYWYGITLRIAVSFLAIAAMVAGAGHLALVRSRSR